MIGSVGTLKLALWPTLGLDASRILVPAGIDRRR